MEVEKGVMMVAYKQSGRKKRYLVLQRKKNWEGWETPKGHLEEDDYRYTVELELKEEAGIESDQVREVEELDEEVSWTYERGGEEFRKDYRVFIVEVDEDVIPDVSENPCDEHETALFLSYRDAESLITYENNRKILEKARDHIN
ncbi:MAG: NUDIX domain-containing protein [Candidatus Nanohaloarchaea archaeon]